MIGIDTNVLVRYIVEDDAEQTALATELLEQKCTANNPAFISLMVVCELVWVLNRAYKAQRNEIAEVLQNILLTENFMIEHHDIAWQAFHDFSEGNVDFSDCLISRMAQLYGCETIWTFDKTAARLSQTSLLKK